MISKKHLWLVLSVVAILSMLLASCSTTITSTATMTTTVTKTVTVASTAATTGAQPGEMPPALPPDGGTGGGVTITIAAHTFYPGVYSDAELAMLEKAKQGMGGGMGPPPGGSPQGPQSSTDAPMQMTITEADIMLYANAFDYWNPLWTNEEYAKNTRYGGIIAPPFEQEAPAMFPTLGPAPEIGAWNGTNDGGDMEFFIPIRPGDSFTARMNPPVITDETPEEGSTTRTFAVEGSGTLINQNGEEVVTGTMYGHNSFATGIEISAGTGPAGAGPPPGGAPGGAPPDGGGAPPPGAPPGGGVAPTRHTYTEDDWGFIHQLEDSEVVRGADTLFWEDVNIGDEPPWTVIGPTTTLDMIQRFGMQIIRSAPMREQLKNKDMLVGLKQDQYGVYHLMEEGHFSEAGMGGQMPIFYMAFGRSELVRFVTNYIGDDGWLRKFSWWNGHYADELISVVPQLKGKSVTGHGSVGDILISKGYVTDKFIAEDGTHRISMVVWNEDIVGVICQAARVEIILPTRS